MTQTPEQRRIAALEAELARLEPIRRRRLAIESALNQALIVANNARLGCPADAARYRYEDGTVRAVDPMDRRPVCAACQIAGDTAGQIMFLLASITSETRQAEGAPRYPFLVPPHLPDRRQG